MPLWKYVNWEYAKIITSISNIISFEVVDKSTNTQNVNTTNVDFFNSAEAISYLESKSKIYGKEGTKKDVQYFVLKEGKTTSITFDNLKKEIRRKNKKQTLWGKFLPW